MIPKFAGQTTIRLNQRVKVKGLKGEDAYLNGVEGRATHPFAFGCTDKGWIGVRTEPGFKAIAGESFNVRATEVDLPMTPVEIMDRVNEFQPNIWSNPKRPSDIQENQCECCGRKLGKNPRYVHITVMGVIVPNDITEEHLAEAAKYDDKYTSQGAFPLGSTCVKNLLGDKIDEYSVKSLG